MGDSSATPKSHHTHHHLIKNMHNSMKIQYDVLNSKIVIKTTKLHHIKIKLHF